MQPLRSEKIPAASMRDVMARYGAQYFPERSNSTRHVYFSRRLNRWLAVSNKGGGWLLVNHYAECPCGATR